jgi:alginate O-acetyltransferase complex protein AlgI
MLFSSTVFLFAFLPLVLMLYFVLPGTKLRNGLLLAASLFFYSWGEAGYTLVLLASIGFNYLFGLWIHSARGRPDGRWILAAAATLNLALLGYFKYWNFATESLSALAVSLGLPAVVAGDVHLPIGISFFTFQALTYLVDIHRRQADVQRNPLHVALYIALFPQLIAGPIVRYRQVAIQLIDRHASLDDVAYGVRRFVIGLGKKVLIANQLAVPVDRIFAVPGAELSAPVAWLGALGFALQLYFDFSGYSDMAIGLGRVFGFRFPENFDLPFVSRSVGEFWRRWHISLSTWFRDYLYIPLNANRGSTTRAMANLLMVFLLVGLWHGASWNFVVFGAIHGVCLAAERTPFGAALERRWLPVRHLYTLLVVLVSFVIFRAETLPEAFSILSAMAGATAGSPAYPLALYVDPLVVMTLVVAIVGATTWIVQIRDGLARGLGGPAFGAARLALLNLVLIASSSSLVAGTHNPFIYFRF